MKNILICLVFFIIAGPSQAHLLDKVSLSAGYTSFIGGDKGATGRIILPNLFYTQIEFKNAQLSLEFEISQLSLQSHPYTTVGGGAFLSVPFASWITGYFLNAMNFFIAEGISSGPTPPGWQLAAGVETPLWKQISVHVDAGYILLNDTRADKLPGSPSFGNGFRLMIGTKYYL